MPVIRASLLAVLALISCALALNLARAQDPTTETGTTLHPGINLIGWTAEPTPTSQLFREIPQLEAVWAWDAELDDWIVAARGAPEWLGGLGRLTPGMGLRMQLGGDQPYLWQRSTEPTRGLVKLRTGWNLVAWSGADQTPIDDALKGIGWSLRNVHRWNPTSQQWSTWTSPERTAKLIAADNTDQETNDDSEMPAIRRGEALWINVARAVNWLQPTDILPRLVFPGGASTALKARVREDLEAVLNFYRTQYGIQAEPDFTIYAAKDVDALIQAYKDDGQNAYEASTRALWNRAAGWAEADVEIVIDQSEQHRYLITHEYFHILQYQMSDGDASEQPEWIVEGMAEWAGGEHEVLDRKRTWTALRNERSSAITTDAPSLRAAERENALWHYDLGWLATDRLIADAGSDSWIELWRQFGSTTKVGAHHRWTSTFNWWSAFQSVFGQTLSDFYTTFDAWQSQQPQRPPQADNDLSIRGRVTDETGVPIAGVFVNAVRVEGEISVGRNHRAETGVDGSFAVRAPERGEYRLSLDGGCQHLYRGCVAVDARREAQVINVGGSGASGINIQATPSVYGGVIRGRVVTVEGGPLAGISMAVCDASGAARCITDHTASDGTFALPVAYLADYRLRANLGAVELDFYSYSCHIYFRDDGSTAFPGRASLVRVAESDVQLNPLTIPAYGCERQISGRLIGLDGEPQRGVRVSICDVDIRGNCSHGSSLSNDTGDDGSFAFAVQPGDTLRLTIRFSGCALYYHEGSGVTATRAQASRIFIDDTPNTHLHIRANARMCAQQINGTVTSPNGAPLAGVSVTACRPTANDGCADAASSTTSSDGSYAIIVPADGEYALYVARGACNIYFRRDGVTKNWRERSTVRVDGRRVQMNPRQIPDGLCAYRISGQLVDSSGTPVAHKDMDVCASLDCSRTQTEADGRFAISVSNDGAYSVGVWPADLCYQPLAGEALGSPDNPIRVSGADVTGIVLRLPGTIEELCE